jgi:hypothetical protein
MVHKDRHITSMYFPDLDTQVLIAFIQEIKQLDAKGSTLAKIIRDISVSSEGRFQQQI